MLLKELNLLQLQILMSIQKPECKHDPRLMPKAAAVLVLTSSLHDVNEKPSNERFSCRVATNVSSECCRFLLCILTHLMTLCDQQPSPKFHVTAAAASDVSNAKTRTRKEDGRRQAAGQLPVRVIAAQPECGRHGADCLIKLVKMNRAPHSNWRNVANTIHMFLQNMTHKCN